MVATTSALPCHLSSQRRSSPLKSYSLYLMRNSLRSSPQKAKIIDDPLSKKHKLRTKERFSRLPRYPHISFMMVIHQILTLSNLGNPKQFMDHTIMLAPLLLDAQKVGLLKKLRLISHPYAQMLSPHLVLYPLLASLKISWIF